MGWAGVGWGWWLSEENDGGGWRCSYWFPVIDECCADLTQRPQPSPPHCFSKSVCSTILILNYRINELHDKSEKWARQYYDKKRRGCQVYQCPRINLYVISSVSLSHISVASVEGVCESSRSHTNRKLFIGSHHSAKVRQGPQWLRWSSLVFYPHSSDVLTYSVKLLGTQCGTPSSSADPGMGACVSLLYRKQAYQRVR